MTHIKETVDLREVDHFSSLSQDWWSPTGPFRALHHLNILRLSYIRQTTLNYFTHLSNQEKPFCQLRILDIGCGGGLLCEPLRRLGAHVVGIDASKETIDAARAHAQQQGLDIVYHHTTIEYLSQNREETFDIILAMEVLEHVSCVTTFIESSASLLKKEGLFFFSTLNRTLLSFLKSIVGAEYLLGWVPRGTHRWKKFLKPAELEKICAHHRLTLHKPMGINFQPLSSNIWSIGDKIDTNYMAYATPASWS